MNLREIGETEARLETGWMPKWVDGVWFMNGPSVHNFSEFGVDMQTEHFFDGLAGVTAYDIRSGKVFMRTKILETETFARLRDHHQYDSLTFGTPMSWSSLATPPLGLLKDNTPISLYPYRGHLFATSDCSYRHGLDPGTLETTLAHNVDEHGPIGAAHPAVDPISGEVFNYVGPIRLRVDTSTFSPIAEYYLVQESHDDGNGKVLKREVMASVWTPSLWISHSVGITEKYVIYRVLSERPVAQLDFRFLSNFLEFDHRKMVETIVVDRKTHETRRMSCNEAFSSFHIINSFSLNANGTKLVVDSVASDTGLLNERTNDIFHEGYKPLHARPNISSVENAADIPYFYKRCIIDTTAQSDGTCECESLFRYPFELPTINPLFKMRRHRYVWSVAGEGTTLWSNQIAKIDLEKIDDGKHVNTWNPPPGFVVLEPKMVPHPDGEEEDEGVVFVVVTHQFLPQSKLVTLDAASMEVLSTHILPVDLALQAHGVFLDRNRGGRIFSN